MKRHTDTLMTMAMDTRQERELCVTAEVTPAYGPHEAVVHLADTTILPGWGCTLTAAEARGLARRLADAAAEAADWNLTHEPANA